MNVFMTENLFYFIDLKNKYRNQFKFESHLWMHVSNIKTYIRHLQDNKKTAFFRQQSCNKIVKQFIKFDLDVSFFH